MTRIEIWILFLSLLVLSGCNRFAADASRTTFQPIQISAPALAAGNDRAIAIWQGSGAQQPETKMRELGGAGSAVSVASNAELPSGAHGVKTGYL